MMLRFDIVGDIAIIRNTTDNLTVVAESILQKNKRVKVVLAQSGPVQGIFRLCKLRHVAGEERTTTAHRENGCLFHVDLAAVHFSPRLVHERRLIAESVGPAESVLNMFGGVGTFSVEIARKNPSTRVFNVDVNAEAIRLCLRNILANRLRGRVVAVLADAKEAANSLFLNKMDRVLLPLPEKSREYLDIAVSTLRREGVIHYYDFIDADKQESPLEKALTRISSTIDGKNVSSRGGRIVKSVAPRRYLLSIELHKNRLSS